MIITRHDHSAAIRTPTECLGGVGSHLRPSAQPARYWRPAARSPRLVDGPQRKWWRLAPGSLVCDQCSWRPSCHGTKPRLCAWADVITCGHAKGLPCVARTHDRPFGVDVVLSLSSICDGPQNHDHAKDFNVEPDQRDGQTECSCPSVFLLHTSFNAVLDVGEVQHE